MFFFAKIQKQKTKTKKTNKKTNKQTNKKKTSGHMAQGNQEIKFERNPYRFRDNRCDRRTNFDFLSSADIVKQS